MGHRRPVQCGHLAGLAHNDRILLHSAIAPSAPLLRRSMSLIFVSVAACSGFKSHCGCDAQQMFGGMRGSCSEEVQDFWRWQDDTHGPVRSNSKHCPIHLSMCTPSGREERLRKTGEMRSKMLTPKIHVVFENVDRSCQTVHC